MHGFYSFLNKYNQFIKKNVFYENPPKTPVNTPPTAPTMAAVDVTRAAEDACNISAFQKQKGEHG